MLGLNMHDNHYAAMLNSRSDELEVSTSYVDALVVTKRPSTHLKGRMSTHREDTLDTYEVTRDPCMKCIHSKTTYPKIVWRDRLISVDRRHAEQSRLRTLTIAREEGLERACYGE